MFKTFIAFAYTEYILTKGIYKLEADMFNLKKKTKTKSSATIQKDY